MRVRQREVVHDVQVQSFERERRDRHLELRLPEREQAPRRHVLGQGARVAAVHEFRQKVVDDNRGVLVLSRFAGAARELADALVVNPYAIEDSARVLAQALHMTGEEQASRMSAMRAVVANFNAYRWVGEILTDASRLRQQAGEDAHPQLHGLPQALQA